MRWFLADVLGLFSINVGPFSRNVVPSDRIFSINLVPKHRMFSVPVIYVLGPLHLTPQVTPAKTPDSYTTPGWKKFNVDFPGNLVIFAC